MTILCDPEDLDGFEVSPVVTKIYKEISDLIYEYEDTEAEKKMAIKTLFKPSKFAEMFGMDITDAINQLDTWGISVEVQDDKFSLPYSTDLFRVVPR